MKDIDEQKKIAVLIDADNAQYSKLKQILQEIAGHGHIITKRAYGDWSSENLKNWKDELNINAIQPIQQFAYTTGKNSTDSAMIIDAMDLLYTQKYDAFVIVSSDSDFTKLASRLRESEIFVFGVGEKKTPKSFINACDDFIILENVNDNNTKISKSIVEKSKIEPSKDKDELREIRVLLNKAYDLYVDDDGWANIAAAGQYLKRSNSAFDPRTYGFKKLPDLVESLKNEFTIKRYPGKGGVTIVAFQVKEKT